MKYINAELLREEIEKIYKSEIQSWLSGVSPKSVIYEYVLPLIDSLQQEQPEVDLETFDKSVTKMWGRCAAEPNDTIACLHIDSFIDVARHFFNLGCTRTAEKYDEIEYNRQRAEERVQNDLEEAANNYASVTDPEAHGIDFIREVFIAGAEWRDAKSGSSETPRDLEEAAEAFAFKSLDEVILYGCTLSGRRACFIAGAKWQEEQDQETIELAEDHAYLAGAVNEREKMMKEAVEGEIFDDYDKDTCEHHLTILSTVPSGYKDGDKIRIIIVKEDKK